MMVSLLDQPKYLKNFYDRNLSQVTFSANVFTTALAKFYPLVHAHLVPLNFLDHSFLPDSVLKATLVSQIGEGQCRSNHFRS